MTILYVDSDACPVKEEVLRVALRHGCAVVYVGNRWMRGLDHPMVSQIVAPEGMDQADNVIAEKIAPGDVVVTADVPLASRCIAKGAVGIDPRGKRFDGSSMGMALAVRDLMTHLRDTGEISGGGPAPYGKQDRSRFLDELDKLLRQLIR